MMKIETHLHCLGGSVCATCSANDIVNDYKAAGYDGVVLTNHMSPHTVESSYLGLNPKERTDAFYALYDNLKEKGARENFKVFYGIEVRCAPTNTEYMLYGFSREFLYKNADLFTCSQQELFSLASSAGVFMYQTHPFRAGVKVGDPKYMHGAEAFNGHFHHMNNNALANDFCEKNGLIKMFGTDYHEKGQPITSCAFVPDNVNDVFALTEYLRSGNAEFKGDEVYYQEQNKKYREMKGRCK